ncbi:MAG: hypothetical protein ACJ764_08675 [Solirubrobacteraceae bacterium]
MALVETGQRSLFVSSCTRRELARRRPKRFSLPIQVVVALVLLAAALGLLVVAPPGL